MGGPHRFRDPERFGPECREEDARVIEFSGVSYAYQSSGAGAHAVSGVSFRVEPGRMLAVLGANGSGKSTIARLANGLLLPMSGSVQVDGVDTRDTARSREIRTKVGAVFQRPDDQIVATSVEDDVAFGPENLGLERGEIRRRVDAALEAVGMEGTERQEPHLLSGGQKQRLAIAGALAMRPRYLVLDEPTSMIDPQGKAEVLEVLAALRQAGHGILYITHDLSEVTAADGVVALDTGSVAYAGDLAGLLSDEARLISLGLEVPPVMRLASKLAECGAPVAPGTYDPASILEVLCP